MKITKIIYLLLLVQVLFVTAQQNSDDLGRIVLKTFIPQNNNIPEEAQKSLETKLNQMISNYGMAGSELNPRFVLMAKINIGTKDIVAGPPQMVSQNMDITLFVGDAINNTLFSSVTISVKGVGTNENKAYIDAFKSLNTNDKNIAAFLDKGKKKIVDFYASQCGFIIQDATALAKQKKYEEALYHLSQVPTVCENCYGKVNALMAEIYQQKIDTDCNVKYNQAKILWNAHQKNTDEITTLLSEIDPQASCYSFVLQLSDEIKSKSDTEEKAKLRLALKKYNDNINLEKKRIEAYREIAVEYARTQPEIIYNNINWR